LEARRKLWDITSRYVIGGKEEIVGVHQKAHILPILLVKFTLEQARQAHRGSRGIALLCI
jgi:hypothetical protein